MTLPKSVNIIEVSPRDGLQNEAITLPTAIKIDFINLLSSTGLKTIEASSFVSPKWIPQLADASKVLSSINKPAGVIFPVLVPNEHGMQKAMAAGAKCIAVFTSASETFSHKNTNSSIDQSMKNIEQVMQMAHQANIPVRGYISCTLGCPYEGFINTKITAQIAKQLLDLGCYQISLGDTIGVGTPLAAKRLIDAVAKNVPISKIAAHFHDTYGQALANIYAVLEQGVSSFDSSIGGIGGCPYAHGASGNVATEDLIYMLQGMQIETGIDMQKILSASKYICTALGHSPKSKVALALNLN